jgi:CO/xanthine dehydrogenase Mo-binding subunit
MSLTPTPPFSEPKLEIDPLTRRKFIKTGLASLGGLFVGAKIAWPGVASRDENGEEDRTPADDKSGAWLNAWVGISSDGEVHLMVDKAEMGQGIMTTLATLVAEELDLDPTKIRLHFAPSQSKFGNPKLYGAQLTGGSTSIAASWSPLREAAAAVRELLIEAAAKQSKKPASNYQISDLHVVDKASGQKIGFAELVAEAAKLPVPKKPRCKTPAEYRLLGRPQQRLDSRDKITGKAGFGIDVGTETRADLLTCVILRSPVRNGRLKSFSPASSSRSSVRHLVKLKGGLAILADSFWEALEASKEFTPIWDFSHTPLPSTKAIRRDYLAKSTVKGSSISIDHPGRLLAPSDAEMRKEILNTANGGVHATYELPYTPHSTMEPMNCTAHVRAGRCDIWVPTQAPGGAQEIAAQITGLSTKNVHVHSTYLGGGFGRRIYLDFIAEAVEVSKQVGKPVKVMWTREDDFQNDYYRPAATHTLSGAAKADSTISHWHHHVVTQSIMQYTAEAFADSITVHMLPNEVVKIVTELLTGFFRGGIWHPGFADPTSFEGILTDSGDLGLTNLRKKAMSYPIANFMVEGTFADPTVPIGFWRSVGHSHTAFAIESFIDELAHSAGVDPFEFRGKLLAKANATRPLAVLELVARKSNWGSKLPSGVFRGIAYHQSFDSYNAQVIEIKMENGLPKVLRVVSAVDCGFVLNPDLAAAQVESAVIFGLSAALKQEITLKNGVVEQTNFHQCDLLRMHECPVIETYFVPSTLPPTGIGEICVPAVAPALANAVFAATGTRYRKLPITPLT